MKLNKVFKHKKSQKKHTALASGKFKAFMIYLNVILVIIIFILIFSFNNSITFNAISDFAESNETINPNPSNTIASLDYQPGLEKEIQFSIFNPEHKNMKILLMAQGELNYSITLYDSLIEFNPSDNRKDFLYKIKIPVGLSPGLHTAEIAALEVPMSSSGSYAGSKIRKISEVNVYVPYPGKYVEPEIFTYNREQDKNLDIIITVTNRGETKIENCFLKLDVYTILNEKVTNFSIDSSPIFIEPLKSKNISLSWAANVLPGDYILKYVIFYDDENRNFEKNIAIGARNMSIEGILVNNFQLGGIAKLQALVENKWDQKLENVYIQITVYDKSGQSIAEIKSSVDYVDSLSKKELIAYWDTKDLEEGEYNARLVVNYEDRSISKDMVFRISQDSFDVFAVGFVVSKKLMKDSTLTTILMIVVILLLMVNLFWFILFKRMNIKKKKK